MAVKAKRLRRKQDLARAVDLAARVFSTYFVGVEQWTEELRIDPGYAPGQSFAVEVEGEIVSQLRVTLRQVRLGGGVGLLGGIGDVATHPEHRNRGYGSACLEEAIRFMQEAGCCLSALGTGRFSFYGRLGWVVAVPGYRVQLSTTGPPAAALDGFGRRLFRPEDDLPTVMRVYEQARAGRLLSVVRDEDYWRRRYSFSLNPPFHGPMGYLKDDPEGFWVIHDTQRAVVAYARSRRTTERLEVVEAAAADRRAALALLAHVAEQYRERREIVLDEPPDSLLAEVALTACGAQCAVAHSGTMVRMIDLRRLFDAMAPAFAARIRASELAAAAGALRLETEIGAVTLQWDRGEVAVSRARARPSIALPYRALTQMVMGYRSATSVLDEAGRLDRTQASTLRALEVLFPRIFPHLGALDRF